MVILPNRGPCCTGYRAKHAEILSEQTWHTTGMIVSCEAKVQPVQAIDSQEVIHMLFLMLIIMLF